MVDIVTSATSDDPTLPFDGPRGFASAGLTGLYFVDGSDTTANIANAAGGGATAVVPAAGATSGWSAASLMTNGGIQLRGNTILPGPTMDLTLPWTMFMHGAVGLPTDHGVTTWVSPILSTDQYVNLKGVIMYASVGSAYPTTSTPLNPGMRWTNNGAQVAPVVMGAPVDLTYLDPVTFAFSYNLGSLRTRIFRGGAKIQDLSQAVTIANVVNGTPSQKLTVSTNQINFAEANILCEVFGTYSRELSDNDLTTTDLVASTIRTARGR